MADRSPWRSAADLRALLAAWRRACVGRDVTQVVVGEGWIRLTLAAPDGPPARLFFCARPGAVLLCGETAAPPPALREALGPPRRQTPAARLRGLRLLDARVFPADLAVALAFAPRGGGAPCWLVHQLYGSRGNLLLVESGERLVWAMHPGAPLALLAPPPPATGANDDAPPAGDAAIDVFRESAHAHLAAQLGADLIARCERALRQAGEACARLQANLARDLAEAKRGDELRRLAEALAAGLAAVPRGAARVELPDPGGGPALAVALDPALSPAANMAEYFRRARKADRGHALIAARLDAARRRGAELAAARAELAAALDAGADRLGACLGWRRAHAALLGLPATAARAPREAPAPARPFRRYLVEERWEVWLGRDNTENDLLTHGTAAPDDIWLHAQGVPGSHAVLRTGGRPEAVPRRVLEKAAALAALHSRARHSALVPVVHTLRKYVRKPRRSAPGTAVCQREKTLFAPPVVPAGVEPA